MNELYIILSVVFSIYIVGVIILKFQNRQQILNKEIVFVTSWIVCTLVALVAAIAIYNKNLELAFALTPLAILSGAIVVSATIMKVLSDQNQ